MFIEHEFYIEIVEYGFLISVGQFSNADPVLNSGLSPVFIMRTN